MERLNLEIINQEGVIFKGSVSAITSSNNKGVFDVLPKHTNFISIIKDFITIHLDAGNKKEIKIKRGVLRCLGNKVNVFLGV